MPRNNKNKAKTDYRNIIKLHKQGVDNATIQSVIPCSRSKVKDTVNFYKHAEAGDFEFFRTQKYQKYLLARVALETAGRWDEYQNHLDSFRDDGNKCCTVTLRLPPETLYMYCVLIGAEDGRAVSGGMRIIPKDGNIYSISPDEWLSFVPQKKE